jgi:hypothetical protein
LGTGRGGKSDGATYLLTAEGEAFREHASAGTPGGGRRAEAGKARRKARGAASAEAAAAALADGGVADEEWLAEGKYVGEELLRQVQGPPREGTLRHTRGELRDAVEMCSRCARDVLEMCSRCARDVLELARCGRWRGTARCTRW